MEGKGNRQRNPLIRGGRVLTCSTEKVVTRKRKWFPKEGKRSGGKEKRERERRGNQMNSKEGCFPQLDITLERIRRAENSTRLRRKRGQRR